MVNFAYCLTSLLFFDISLLYYYINLRLSWFLIDCFPSGEIYHSLGISSYFVTVSELFCGEVSETVVISSAILLPIKLPVAFADIWIAHF